MPVPKTPAAPRTKDKVEGKPKSYHHGNLREALLETGLELLRRDSAESLGLRELARPAIWITPCTL